jgi:hypothetical protein
VEKNKDPKQEVDLAQENLGARHPDVDFENQEAKLGQKSREELSLQLQKEEAGEKLSHNFC